MLSTRRRDARTNTFVGSKALSSCLALTTLASLLLVAPAMSEAANGAPLERRTRRPNVLIFLTDDQRIGTLKHMPATRRLIGRKGVTYKNAFATTPLCCPSRASIMTGRYAHNHAVRNNSSARHLDMSTTLQHNLHEAGYLTSIVGKFLNGWNPAIVPPDIDRSVLLTPSSSRFAQGTNAYNDSLFGIDGQLHRVSRYATDFMRSQVVRILGQFNRSDQRPWTMFVHPYAPHIPTIPARRHALAPVGAWRSNPAIRNRDRSDKAPVVRRSRVEPRKRFALDQKRTLLAVDEMVARVFRTLNDLNETRRTLVFFVSDNGMSWGEHGLFAKRFPYTHSVKVPMLMRWTGHIPPNSSAQRLAANIDIAPTVYDATGVEPTHVMDGSSLLAGSKRRVLLLENWERTEWSSLRSRRYQYIEYYGGGKIQFRELYDLKRDPWQLRNRLHWQPRRHRDIAARLHRRLERYRHCKGTSCP